MNNNIRVFKITNKSQLEYASYERLSDLKLIISYNDITGFEIRNLLDSDLPIFLIIDIDKKSATFTPLNNNIDVEVEPISNFLKIIPYIDYESNLPFNNNIIELENHKIIKIIDKFNDYYLCVDANGYATTVEPTDIYRFINNPTYLKKKQLSQILIIF